MKNTPTVSKETASYRVEAAKRFCKDCTMFKQPNGCTLVRGYISRTGTCKFFEAKKS